MAKSLLLGCALLVTSLPLASASIFVTNLVDGSNPLPIGGNQSWQGQLGDDFTTTETISISSVGVFDSDGNGTLNRLIWRLYEVATGTLVHEEVVLPSGVRVPGSTIEDNYVFAPLASNLILAANTTYSVVAVGFSAADENFNTNMDLANLDVVFNSLGLTGAGGRYSNDALVGLPTVDAGNTASAQPYNFGAATFVYGVVPEPASVAIWTMIACVGGLVAKKNF